MSNTNPNGALERPKLAVGLLWTFSVMCGLMAAILLSSGLLTTYGELDPQFLSWGIGDTVIWMGSTLIMAGFAATAAYLAHRLRVSEFAESEEVSASDIKWKWYECLLVGAVITVSFIAVTLFT